MSKEKPTPSVTSADVEKLARDLATARAAQKAADAAAAEATAKVAELEKSYARAGQSLVESFHKNPHDQHGT